MPLSRSMPVSSGFWSPGPVCWLRPSDRLALTLAAHSAVARDESFARSLSSSGDKSDAFWRGTVERFAAGRREVRHR